jgi:hypothetical protein
VHYLYLAHKNIKKLINLEIINEKVYEIVIIKEHNRIVFILPIKELVNKTKNGPINGAYKIVSTKNEIDMTLITMRGFSE